MENIMTNIIMGIILIIMGLYFAIFSKKHAKYTVGFYYKLLKVRSSEQFNEIGFLWGGIAFVLIGIWMILSNIL